MKARTITKDKMIRLAAMAVLIVAGVIWWRIGESKKQQTVEIVREESSVISQVEQSAADNSAETEIQTKERSDTVYVEESVDPIMIGVHVSGAVRGPDLVYLLPEGSRVSDAISAAGGAMDTADLSLLNLAEYLVDGERIFVPEKEGKMATSMDRFLEGQFVTMPADSNEEGTDGSSEGVSHLTNINSATKIELMELPGIGESYAERIIEYRESNGPFGSINEIMNVSGIGESKFEKLKFLITVE